MHKEMMLYSLFRKKQEDEHEAEEAQPPSTAGVGGYARSSITLLCGPADCCLRQEGSPLAHNECLPLELAISYT